MPSLRMGFSTPETLVIGSEGKRYVRFVTREAKKKRVMAFMVWLVTMFSVPVVIISLVPEWEIILDDGESTSLKLEKGTYSITVEPDRTIISAMLHIKDSFDMVIKSYPIHSIDVCENGKIGLGWYDLEKSGRYFLELVVTEGHGSAELKVEASGWFIELGRWVVVFVTFAIWLVVVNICIHRKKWAEAHLPSKVVRGGRLMGNIFDLSLDYDQKPEEEWAAKRGFFFPLSCHQCAGQPYYDTYVRDFYCEKCGKVVEKTLRY